MRITIFLRLVMSIGRLRLGYLLVPIIFVALLVGCSSREPSNSGPFAVLRQFSWISDKEGTVVWIAKHRAELAKSEKLKAIFGKLILSYSQDTVTTIFNGVSETRKHTFLGQTDREVCWIADDPLQNRDVIVMIEMDEDQKGYWIYNYEFDIREHFIRKE